jgi:hypothetical protein
VTGSTLNLSGVAGRLSINVEYIHTVNRSTAATAAIPIQTSLFMSYIPVQDKELKLSMANLHINIQKEGVI